MRLKQKCILIICSILFCLDAHAKTDLATKPNVIVIMTDDQGYPELSIHGNPILKTPHLDKLAQNSVRFAEFHVAPMCAPTRGQLLTGVDAASNGLVNVSSGRAFLKPELPTMANLFLANGYGTGVFGKWHLGANYPYRPQDRGFEESVWFSSSHIGSVSDYWGNDYFDDTYWHNGKHEKYSGYCTDVFFGEAKNFMEQSVEEEKPFFAYISTNTPHGPLVAKEEDIKVLEALYDQAIFSKKTEQLKSGLVKYLAMIRNIDINVGSLIDFLDEKGLRDNTIVIFLTDNGSTQGHRYFNAGMRGMKTELWDGGHRVPLLVSWPDGDFKQIGTEVPGLSQVQDILPTLVELCGLNMVTALPFDGMSLAPVLRNEAQIDEDRMLILNYSRMPNFINYPAPYGQTIVRKEGAAVLWKGWRLLESRELYNLETDPLQKENVYSQHLDIVEKMKKPLDTWWDKVKDDVNEHQKIIIGSDHENPSILTACDWLDVFVDQQPQVSRGVRKNSYWCLDVAQEGDYNIELRRWPKETDSAIAGTCSMIDRNGQIGGIVLPITSASIYLGGMELRSISEKRPYGFEGLTKEIAPEDKAVTFDVHLKPGPIYLHTFFHMEGQGIIGAYYAYVTRK